MSRKAFAVAAAMAENVDPGSAAYQRALGGLLVAVMNTWCISLAASESLPAIHGKFEAWRYTLISGVFPALPLIFIRPFLPESPAWQRKQEARVGLCTVRAASRIEIVILAVSGMKSKPVASSTTA